MEHYVFAGHRSSHHSRFTIPREWWQFTLSTASYVILSRHVFVLKAGSLRTLKAHCVSPLICHPQGSHLFCPFKESWCSRGSGLNECCSRQMLLLPPPPAKLLQRCTPFPFCQQMGVPDAGGGKRRGWGWRIRDIRVTGVPCLHLSSQPGVSARRESEERLERKERTWKEKSQEKGKEGKLNQQRGKTRKVEEGRKIYW